MTKTQLRWNQLPQYVGRKVVFRLKSSDKWYTGSVCRGMAKLGTRYFVVNDGERLNGAFIRDIYLLPE